MDDVDEDPILCDGSGGWSDDDPLARPDGREICGDCAQQAGEQATSEELRERAQTLLEELRSIFDRLGVH